LNEEGKKEEEPNSAQKVESTNNANNANNNANSNSNTNVDPTAALQGLLGIHVKK